MNPACRGRQGKEVAEEIRGDTCRRRVLSTLRGDLCSRVSLWLVAVATLPLTLPTALSSSPPFKGRDSIFFKKYIYLFIYFWLHWVFVAARGLSLVAASGSTLRCGAKASHRGGFSYCRAQALGSRASVVVARRLSSCGARA